MADARNPYERRYDDMFNAYRRDGFNAEEAERRAQMELEDFIKYLRKTPKVGEPRP